MKIKAVSPIQHDGKRYEPGETLDAKEDVAQRLIALGSAVPVKGKPDKE